MGGDPFTDGLDPAQALAVTTTAEPLCILAPAGSGKTRVLTRRIARRSADGSADPRHVLALTFTRRAAGELQKRLARLGIRDRPTAGTFHAVAWSLVRLYWQDHQMAPRELVTRRPQLVTEALHAGAPALARLPVAVVAREIDWARARMVPADRYEVDARAAARRPGLPLAAVAEAFAAYDEAKRRRRLVDFDDLLELSAQQVERDPAWAEAVRWRFRHLFVDEYQDVNPLQQRVLEAWRGSRSDLCVVGDPNQAIYGWNGADAGWLTRFQEHHPGAVVVHLTRSYRSTPPILAAAQAVLGAGGIVTEAPEPMVHGGERPAIASFADEAGEAAGIAAWLRSARGQGRPWSSCAVLVRTNAQLDPMLQGLRAAGVPARVRGAAAVLEEPLVRALLRQVPDHGAPGSLRDLAELAEAATAQDPETGAGPTVSLGPLLQLAWEHLEDDPHASVTSLRTWLAGGGPGDDAGGRDAVTLITFHAAKGLEWPVVAVAGLEEGLVPLATATSPEARAEEVRLLYVALTRAERALLCTWAARRGTSRRARTMSPLLAAVAGSLEPLAPSAPPSRLPRAAPPEDPVLTALRDWRRAAAAAAATPEPAVCPDHQLVALARARPTTLEQVADVMGPMAARRLGPRVLQVVAGALSQDHRPRAAR